MLFSSTTFIYLFLPIAVGGYFLCPRRLKNLWLFGVSLFFYAYGEPIYVFLMLLAALAGYFLGRAIERRRERRRLFLLLAVIFYVGILIFFKYWALIGSVLPLPPLDIPLPIGISFYTFQALSYVIDVYRGETKAERSLVNFGTYLALFPQLIAGPIVKYTDVAAALSSRRHSIGRVSSGTVRFCVGLAKKAILANSAGALGQLMIAERDLLSVFLWLLLFALQIYYDFSGYSDMAIGLGRIFGFDFPENFNYPYVAESITDFWRRWHMTLSGWFREYVYIPLGGNRRGRLRTVVNLFAVWALTGLWHGAAWTFVVWGLLFAVLLVAEKWTPGLKQLPNALSHVYVMLVVIISFVIFNANSMAQAGQDLAAMFGLSGLPLVTQEAVYYLRSYGILLLAGIIGATPLPYKLFTRCAERWPVTAWLLPVGSLVLLLVCTAYLVDGSFNPFLYFRF